MRKQDERAFFMMSWVLILGGFYVLFSDIGYGLLLVVIGLFLNHRVRALFIKKYNEFFNPEAIKKSSASPHGKQGAKKINFNFGPILKKIKRTLRRSKD